MIRSFQEIQTTSTGNEISVRTLPLPTLPAPNTDTLPTCPQHIIPFIHLNYLTICSRHHQAQTNRKTKTKTKLDLYIMLYVHDRIWLKSCAMDYNAQCHYPIPSSKTQRIANETHNNKLIQIYIYNIHYIHLFFALHNRQTNNNLTNLTNLTRNSLGK